MARIKVSGTNLTKHFTFAEYAKNQTGTVKLAAAAMLQAQCMEEFRQWLAKPMTINSWFRTAAYNKKSEGTRSPLICAAARRIGAIRASAQKILSVTRKNGRRSARRMALSEKQDSIRGASISAAASHTPRCFIIGTCDPAGKRISPFRFRGGFR